MSVELGRDVRAKARFPSAGVESPQLSRGAVRQLYVRERGRSSLDRRRQVKSCRAIGLAVATDTEIEKSAIADPTPVVPGNCCTTTKEGYHALCLPPRVTVVMLTRKT
jgi:hypothetical protein